MLTIEKPQPFCRQTGDCERAAMRKFLGFINACWRKGFKTALFPAFLFVLVAFPASSPWAEAALTLRGGVHEDFDRLVFDWPRHTDYKIARNGNLVQIVFSASASLDFKPFVTAKITRAQKYEIAEKNDSSLTVRFEVSPDATVKDFVSGNAVVIDLLSKPNAAEKKKPPVEAKASPKEPAKEPPVKEPSVKEPSAKEPEPAPKPAETVNPAPASAPTPTPSAAPEQSSPAPETAESKAPTEPAPPLEAPQTAVQSEPLPEKPAKLYAPFPEIGNEPEVILSLNPNVDMGTAVFVRGGYAYLLFDRKLNLDLKNLTSQQPAPRVALEALDLPQNNGFRFAVPDGIDIRATHVGTVWQVSASRQMRSAAIGQNLVSQPDFALGSRLLYPTRDSIDPVRFTDPVVGDELIVIPSRQPDSFTTPRRFVEVEILPSAQGLVLKPWIDKLMVRKVSDGLEITKTGGLILSPTIDTGAWDDPSVKAKGSMKGIFDITSWRGKVDETYTEAEQRLLHNIVDVPVGERNRARLDLARFLFARGLSEESLGILKYLASTDPDLKNYAEFQALNGAAKIASNRIAEGMADLTQGELKSQPESLLWQAVANVQTRDWQGAEEKFVRIKDLLLTYREPFYSKFMVLAIESALAMDKDREAADWLMTLESKSHRPEVDPAIAYLRGVLHSKAGRASTAEALWKKAAQSNDRLYRVRAEMALIDLGVAMKSLTPAQAADKLEVLKYAWRGDELELEILHRLGLFYMDSQNLKSAMATLALASRLYPDSPLTPQIHDEMVSAFRDAFSGKGKKPPTPLEALSLYQNYGDLMPSGDVRIAMIKNLVEQLVAVDLLDQACDLLESLIKNGLQGEEKAKVGTRLAAIRLLDHKADAALAALNYGPNENIPPDLTNQRLLMRARALSELNKPDEALTLLQSNDTAPAKLLRASINMRAMRWSDAAKALLDIVGPPPANGAKLTDDQSRLLVNCAVAMALAGDSAGLDRLAIDYGPVLANIPQNDAFRVLTRPEKTSQPKNLAAAQARIAEVDLFRGFLDSYRGTSERIETKTVP
jgi:tetratricopeptide (TPR) repeat protein